MCGILGILQPDGKPIDLHALRRATTALRHRGPDDEGYLLVETRSGRTVLCGGENTAPELGLPNLQQFVGERFDLALGFRRLSILDLSAAGHQPMPSEDGRYWLVFNGEVYNYLELRAELATKGYTFKTGSDTEVILAAYAEWGPDCLRRFNGMWGLAIWDNRERTLFVARDRFGVKPFYTVSTPGKVFAFASEIKALLALGAAHFQPSPTAIARFVAQNGFGSHQQGETFFEGVRELPPAHYALISGDSDHQLRPQRYWRLPKPQPHDPLPKERALKEYSALFSDAVRLRLRSDVAVGTCLSGGLDSSSIVAVCSDLLREGEGRSLEQLGERQHTFSAVYDTPGPWNERGYMEMVSERTGATPNYIIPTGERMWSELERLVWHQDEPFQSTSIFAQWCVMGLARERGATVLLDGQGADEVLGGYRPYAVRLAHLLRSGRLLHAAGVARDARSVTGLNPLPLLAKAFVLQAPTSLLARLRGSRLEGAVASSGLRPEVGRLLVERQAREQKSYADQRNLDVHLARLILEDSLPNLLRYEDRNSMAFSIESRLPFLDYRLVEFVFARAGEWRMHEGWTKWLQRKAVEGKLPDEVVWRRDKVGFETPEQKWLREGKDHLLDILSQDDTGSEYLDLQAIRRETPRLLEEPGGPAKVWRWVSLVMWLRCFSQHVKREA